MTMEVALITLGVGFVDPYREGKAFSADRMGYVLNAFSTLSSGKLTWKSNYLFTEYVGIFPVMAFERLKDVSEGCEFCPIFGYV